MSLEELLEKIERAEMVSKKSLDDVPAKNRGGWGSMIREAQDSLPGLKKEHRDTVMKNAVAIYLAGPPDKIQAFLKLVEAQDDGVYVDASELYRTLAEPLFGGLGYTHQLGLSQIIQLQRDIKDIAKRLQLEDYDEPSVKDLPVIPTFADMVKWVKETVQTSLGNGFNKLYLEANTADATLKARFVGKMVPVLITNGPVNDEAELIALARSFGKGYTVVTLKDDEEITPEVLEKYFKEVQKRLRTKK